MKTRTSAKRRSFASDWDEIQYLCDKVIFWLLERRDAARARRFADRLEKLLVAADANHETILGEEGRSLIHQARADWKTAIRHRENEIRLMRRLHHLSCGTPHEAAALQGRGYDVLRDRLDLLATLYYQSGDVDNAVAALAESKSICQEQGLPFVGNDLLKKYQEHQAARAAVSQPTQRRRVS